MGKTSGSSETHYTQNQGQLRANDAAQAAYYNADGSLKTTPDFNYNTDAGLQATGKNYVADFSDPQKFAFGQTLQHYGDQEPWMTGAQVATADAAGPAGQTQKLGNGWTVDPNTGQAQYEDFQSGVNRYMNPFISDVVQATQNQGLYDLQRANLASDNGSVARNSFGGTRQSVLEGINADSFFRNMDTTTANLYKGGFDAATGQYNTGFTQGEQALGYNTGVEQANRAAELAAAAQTGSLATQAQALRGADINAVNAVGAQYQGLDQAQRDAARKDQLQKFGTPMTVASALYGLTGNEDSTKTDSTSSSSAIASGVGTAIGAFASMMSDERAKTDIEDADPKDSLAQIRKLKPKSFNYSDFAQAQGAPAGRRTGFMAQDVERATGQPAPEIGGFKHVDVMEHLGRLTHAVQALDAKVHKPSYRRAA